MARAKAARPAKQEQRTARVSPWGWVLAVAVLLPIVLGLSSRSQFVVVDVAAALAGLAGVLGWSLALVRRDRDILVARPLPRFAIAWSAFALVALVSTAICGRGWDAFMGEPTNMLGWGMLAALTGVAVAGRAGRESVATVFRRFAWLLVLAESLIALWQLGPQHVVTGTLPNSTIFGIAVVLLLPWAVPGGEDIESRELLARWLTVAFALVALAASGARVALAAALAWALWSVARSRAWSTRARWAASGGVLLVVAGAAAVFAGSEFATSLGSAVVGQRPTMWRMAAAAVLQRPVLGWGADGFASGASAISTVARAGREQLLMIAPGATDPHSVLVWVAVSFGVVGLLLFVWFLAEVVLRWLRGADRVLPAVWGVSGAFLVYLTAPAAAQTLPLFALMVGVSLASAVPVGRRSAEDEAPAWSRPAVAAAFVVLGVASALFGLDAVSRATYETAGPARSPRAAAGAQAASDFWRMDGHLAYLASLHWGYAGLADPVVAEQRRDLTAVTRATRLDGRSAVYSTERARTLQFYGADAAQVEAAYLAVFRRYPAYPIARAEYARFLAGQGRVAEATEQLRIAKLVSAEGSSERDQAIQAAEDAIGSAR